MTSVDPIAAPGPLSRVLDALAAGGIGDRSALAARAGVSADLLDSALVHLERLGLIGHEPLGGGCADQGCGACPSGTADASPGCGARSGDGAGRGPIAITLRQP